MDGVSLRILIVEDDAATREWMAELLTEHCCEVACAGDGQLALDALEPDAPPDLILLDLLLPGMDGNEFLTRLRESPIFHYVPVVLCTGLPPDRLARVPADGYLPKPVHPRALLTMVDRFRVTPSSSNTRL